MTSGPPGRESQPELAARTLPTIRMVCRLCAAPFVVPLRRLILPFCVVCRDLVLSTGGEKGVHAHLFPMLQKRAERN